MKANTLTEIATHIGLGNFLVKDIEYVGLLYSKKNYEFKLQDTRNDISYLVRSNGPAIHRIYSLKLEKPIVEIKPNDKGYYLNLITAPSKKVEPKSENLNLSSEEFVNFLKQFNLAVSPIASNKSSLVLTSIPNTRYNDGCKAIKEIYEHVNK